MRAWVSGRAAEEHRSMNSVMIEAVRGLYNSRKYYGENDNGDDVERQLMEHFDKNRVGIAFLKNYLQVKFVITNYTTEFNIIDGDNINAKIRTFSVS
jgi:hypothetical protein